MKKLFIILISLLLLSSISVFSQERDLRLYSSPETTDTNAVVIKDTVVRNGFSLDFTQPDGKVNVNGDSRLKTLTEYTGTAQTGQSVVKMAGFRLQIYYDAEKNTINQKKADYLARYKDEPAYVNYKAPNFRLRVGNFRTRLQAEAYFNEIKVDWPDAIIVEDDIELPEFE